MELNFSFVSYSHLVQLPSLLSEAICYLFWDKVASLAYFFHERFACEIVHAHYISDLYVICAACILAYFILSVHFCVQK